MNRVGTRRTWLVAGSTGLLVLLGAGAAVAVSGDDDGSDQAITGTDLDRASEAALAETGGGTVTGTEVEDEESYYEVEVTREDGSQVDVQLDKDFSVVGTEDEDASQDGAD